MQKINYEDYDPDLKFSTFSNSLAPDAKLPFIGVSVPKLKQIAKTLPFDKIEINCTEDVMLQNIVIGTSTRPFKEKTELLEYILPYYSSWIMTDTLACNLKIKKADFPQVFEYAKELTTRKEVYSIRTGIVVLLSRFLTDEYIDRVLELYKTLSKDQECYTLQMALAWGYSFCVIKFEEKTMKELTSLPLPILKLTAQKCRDSRRVTPETKQAITNLVNNHLDR